MKIIGLLCGWACERYIELSIKQALQLCDEVHVCIAPHSEALKKYEDNTLNIVEKYKDSIKILYWDKVSNHASIKSEILNTMLDNSDIYEAGNWIWILDSDEFYSDAIDYNNFKYLLENTEYNRIGVQDYYFYINMQHYLSGEHFRLFKISIDNLDKNKLFFPTQNFFYSTMKSAVLSKYIFPLFHYGMLFTTIDMKRDFWDTEYQHKQNNKIEWLNKIYSNYNLDDETTWIAYNKELFGIKSPWFSDSFIPNKDSRLFKYNGKHPSLIENSGLTQVKDFRDE